MLGCTVSRAGMSIVGGSDMLMRLLYFGRPALPSSTVLKLTKSIKYNLRFITFQRPIPIPGCANPLDCSLTQFESLYESLVPGSQGKWDEECTVWGIQKTLQQQVKELPTWKVIGSLGLFGFSLFFCYCCISCKKRQVQRRKDEYKVDQGRFLEGREGSAINNSGEQGGGDTMQQPFVEDDDF